MKYFAVLILAVNILACGEDRHGDVSEDFERFQNDNVTADKKKHNVLVIDDGFDLNHPVFYDKVVARYRLRCDGSNGPVFNPKNGFESQKQKLIQFLSYKDSNCILSTKLPFQSSKALESIQDRRDEWNKALLSKSVAETYKDREWEAENIFRTVNDGGRYHGTNTAGLIAYKNDNVNLFILQLELGGIQSILGTTSAVAESICPTQEDINFTAKLYLDADVQKAYSDASLETISSPDAAINEIIQKHRITMVNKSYGLLPLAAIEKNFKDQNCKATLAPLFKAQAELIDKRRLTSEKQTPDTLTIQAAGNEGLEINELQDSLDCSESEDNIIVVGGIDQNSNKTEWTNFGNCVELFAVGERVITPAPLDFLNLSSGTSFAAPMALRYASLNTKPGTDAADIKDILFSKVNTEKLLNSDHFPKELVYENSATVEGYGIAQKRGLSAKMPFAKQIQPTRLLPFVFKTMIQK
ncbi:S8 family serine peptidase [Oligoflexaceae bacterium]|nr:S8 family serine peptidase [Oligoflexaceae bacterium]